MPNLVSRLPELPFFQGMPAEFIKQIGAYAHEEDSLAEHYIFRAGENAATFYIIEQGKVALELISVGSPALFIVTLGKHDELGWSWLFSPYKWHFSARCLEPTKTITFDAIKLRELCASNHSLGFDVMKRVAKVMQERLQATRFQLLDIYGLHKQGY